MTHASYECRLDVFDATDQHRYATLRAALKAAVTEVRELADGYAAHLTPDPAVFRQVAEWITLERRCCPFLALGLDWSDTGDVWLRLTGGPGVKTYLATALASRT
jgi:hypothetical protein